MTIKYKNRELDITEVYGQYEDDIQFTLTWSNTGDTVEDDSIYDFVQDNYADIIYDVWFQNKVSEAEWAYDAARGH